LITHFVSVARVGFYAVLLGTVSNAAVLLLGSPFSSFLAFLLFELCIGMYFPMMGTMKAQLVPEHCRSTLYNIFRLPLNAIVVSSLVFQIGTRSSFFVTTILLAAAAGIQRRISNMEEVERFRPGSPSYHRPGSPKKAEEELVELWATKLRRRDCIGRLHRSGNQQPRARIGADWSGLQCALRQISSSCHKHTAR